MDSAVDAFRISLRHPLPGTSEMTDKAVLVVARSQADAVAIARQACPVPCSAQILQHGPDVLREARERGLDIGGFIELQSR